MKRVEAKFPSNHCLKCMGSSEEYEFIESLACHCFDRRSVGTVLQRMDPDDPVLQEARRRGHRRRQQRGGRLLALRKELEAYEEQLSYSMLDRLLGGATPEAIAAEIMDDQKRGSLIREIRELQWEGEEVLDKDVAEVLQRHQQLGLIEIDATDRIMITARGARMLARKSLRRILQAQRSRRTDIVEGGKRDWGLHRSPASRPYELGDEYEAVDIERTLLSSLSREGRPRLRPEDFFVHESLHESRITAGLLIDESGSMVMNEKIGAAIETSLALSELIGRQKNSRLRVFLFSDRVREIRPWDIVNQFVTGRTTDTRAALIAFRKAVAHDPSIKQAYLITDTSPNTEDGEFVGFGRAMRGVKEEALRYRHDRITLNIVMLDANPRLRAFARALARNNLGRVYFAPPDRLGEVVVEDYLSAGGGG